MRVNWVKPEGFKLKSWEKCQISFYIWVTLCKMGSVVNNRNETKQYFFPHCLRIRFLIPWIVSNPSWNFKGHDTKSWLSHFMKTLIYHTKMLFNVPLFFLVENTVWKRFLMLYDLLAHFQSSTNNWGKALTLKKVINYRVSWYGACCEILILPNYRPKYTEICKFI